LIARTLTRREVFNLIMIELPFAISLCVASSLFGVIGGMLLHYWGEYKPLLKKHDKLIHTLTYMKKQGFVPHYDIKQVREQDLADGVDES